RQGRRRIDQPPSAAASRRVAATNSSSLRSAAPEATAARAIAMPSPIEPATPATYSAAPALSATISSGRPASPRSAPSSIAFDSVASATRRLRLAAMPMPKSSGWISYSRTTPSRSSPTSVAAPSEISSMPSRPQTTSARSVPSSCSTRTWMPTRSGWNTPISTLGAPAGLVSGPRMLKIVRTPISRRTGATAFIAGWWIGANMKPAPTSAMQRAASSGCSSIAAPSASSASALPDFEDTLRLPCLATRPPAAATTNMLAVEMLKVCEPSPPVPTMSTRWRRSATSTGRESSRITRAAAAISSTVSFFTRSPVRIAAAITGETSPRMIWRIRSIISSWKISRCSMVRCRASWGVMVMGGRVPWWSCVGERGRSALQEVLEQCVAVLGEDRFGMELHALDRMRAVAQAHDLLERAVLVFGPGGDLEAAGQRVALDHQRVVARGLVAVGQSREHALSGVPDRRGLAVHDPPGAHHPAAVGLADALVAQAHAQDRDPRPQRLDHRDRDPGLVRRARPWRDHDALGRKPLDLPDRQLVVAHHLHLGPQRLQVLDEVPGEAVVVVDHQQHG